MVGSVENGIRGSVGLEYANRVKIREEKEFSDLVDFYDDFYPIWADKEARKALYGEEFGSGKIYDNDDIQRFVEAVGFKLIPEYAKKEFKFSFVVIDDLSFNASMTPVGLCIVHLGLISSSSNEAQIAAVLGHEIAHAVYHHSLHEAREKQKMKEKKDRRERRRQTFSKIKVGDVTTVLAPELDQKISKSKEKVDKVLDVALEKPKRRKQKDTDILDLVVASANFNDEKLFFSYNREQETQSDRIGLHYLVQAGYDPREAPKVWKKLYQSSEHDSEKTTENESKLVAFLDVLSKKESGNTLFEKGKIKESRTAFRSHPDDLKRYEELNKLIAFYWSNADIIENATKGLIFNW